MRARPLVRRFHDSSILETRIARYVLFEADQDDFGLSTYTHGWSPGARAAGRVHQKLAESLQSVGELAKDTRREPGEREHLPAVRVARKLERYTLFLRNCQALWDMSK